MSADLEALVARVQGAARAQGAPRPAASAARLAAYRARLAGARELVLAADAAVELGSPRRRSAHAAVWSTTAGVVRDAELVVLGPDLGAAGAADRAYVQLTLLELAPGPVPDAAQLEAPQLFTRQLPGLQARMLPGRLWLRASRDAVAAGLDFALLAAALGEAYRAALPAAALGEAYRAALPAAGGGASPSAPPPLAAGRGASPSAPPPPMIRAVECVFASGADEDVAALAALAAEARVLTGRHHRLTLGADGAFECVELDCAACDERPVCDRLRAATVIRRRERLPSAAGGAGGAP